MSIPTNLMLPKSNPESLAAQGFVHELEAKVKKSREDSEKLMEAVVKELLEGASA